MVTVSIAQCDRSHLHGALLGLLVLSSQPWLCVLGFSRILVSEVLISLVSMGPWH